VVLALDIPSCLARQRMCILERVLSEDGGVTCNRVSNTEVILPENSTKVSPSEANRTLMP
jgi:hypothetical protein